MWTVGAPMNVDFLSLEVSQTSAACSDIGSPITVTLTVTDVNNISDECLAVVTVQDNTLPTVSLPTRDGVPRRLRCGQYYHG